MSQLEVHRRRRPRSSCAQQIVEATTELRAMVHHENLLAVFRRLKSVGGRAPGSDRRTYDDYGAGEIAAALREVSRQVLEGTYCARPFRHVRIPKRSLSAGQDGGYRELSIATVLDRCVSTAVHRALTPILDRTFLDSSYGFRSGRGVWQLLLQIERDIRTTGHTILFQDDVRDAFPSVRLERLFQLLSNHISDPQLVSLIERMFRFERGKNEIGLPQGDAFAPTALNLTLHYALDILVFQEPHLGWYRYADNLIGLAASLSEAAHSLATLEGHLAAAGFYLKHVPDSMVDLSKRTASVLGYAIRWKDGQLKVSFPDQAWAYLAQSLEDGLRSPTPDETARLTTRGWILAYGPAFGNAAARYEAPRIVNILSQLDLETPTRHEILQWINEAKGRWARVKGEGMECASPRPPFDFDDADQLLVNLRVDNLSPTPPWIGEDV